MNTEVGKWEQAFLEHMSTQSNPDYDPYAHAHDQAFLDFYQSEPRFRSTILKSVPDIVRQPDQAAFKLQKSTQAIAARLAEGTDGTIPEDSATFPLGYDTLPPWTNVFEIISDDEILETFYIFNLRLPIASNVSERGKLFKALALLSGSREPLSIMDIGCSLNLNLKRLASYEEGGLDYQPVTIYTRDPDGQPVLDENRTEIFNDLINNPLRLGQSLGIDIFDPERDEPFKAWAKSNSFRMSELINPAITGTFDRLMATQPENVSYQRADAASPNGSVRITGQYDMLMISTMLYMLDDPDRLAVLENADKWADDGSGLVAVLDFMDFLPEGKMRFYAKKVWPWRYKMWAKDMEQAEGGFQHYFTAEDGRASRIILEPAVGRLAIAQELGLAPDY